MARKRLTQIFPFLLPLRRWQKKKFFYLKMRFDRNRYAKKREERVLPYMVFETSSLMINEHSGFDIRFQHNKAHNLRLAAQTLDRLVIAPGETFSFWHLVRHADQNEPYREALSFADGKTEASYGGGLCQLGGMLFQMFLHTPLTVTERHGHTVLSLPPAESGLCGVDAAVSEGWLDLKIRNDTPNRFQIVIDFDDRFIHGRILAQMPLKTEYMLFNSSVTYIKTDKKIFQIAAVCRRETHKETGEFKDSQLYVNRCEIAYPLPENIHIEEHDRPQDD